VRTDAYALPENLMLRCLLRLIACLLVVSCSREPAVAPATSASSAPAAANQATHATTATGAVANDAQAPTESSLEIKRGTVTLAKDRTTYRPCGEKTELWLLDQTDGVLRQAFPKLPEEAAIYVEVYGERTQTPKDIATAKGYTGALILEELLYAAQGKDGTDNCAAEAPTYVVAARGAEPFWSAEIREKEIMWRQSESPREVLMQIPDAADTEGTVSYRGVAEGYSLEMEIEGQPCRDASSGEYFAYSARASLNGKEFNGCARVGS
jgi:uncharacterized membrane protein